MSSLLFDLRLIVRGFWRRPGFTIAATVPLALAMGANTTLFHITDALVLQPRALMDSQNLYVLWETSTRRDGLMSEISYPDFLDWRRENRSFQDMAAMGSINWSHGWSEGGDGIREILYRAVSWSFFDVLGVDAAMGRTFVPEDEERGADRIAVVSHGFWQSQLGGLGNVVGQTILLGPEGNEPYTVVGVMPPELAFPGGAQLWTPLGRDLAGFGGEGFDAVSSRGLGVLFAIGRLRPGTSLAEAAADVSAIVRHLARDAHQRLHWRAWRASVTSLEVFELGQTPVGLWVLGGAAASLFLMSCFSVGGLFLARSMAGRRELAIASAIGAGPGVVVRKALLESAIAVLVSALAAWAFTLVATPLVLSRLPVASSLGVSGTGIDIAVLAALSAFAVILIALPTTVSIRPGHLFRTIASGLSLEGSLLGWQKPLIAATTAIAMVLVTAAGLLVRSYVELVSTDLGFRPDKVLSLQVGSPEGANGRARRAFFRGLVERIESLDGVVAAASVSNRPLLHGAVGDDWTFINEHQTEADRDTNPTLNYVVVSPRYFRVMGIRLVAGRSFDEQDRESSPGVVVIGESLARYAWPSESALGRRIWLGARDEAQVPIWLTVVGVVADARYRGLTTSRLDLYRTFEQTVGQPLGVVVRTRDDPYAVAPAIREQVRAVDSNLDIERVTSMQDAVHTARAPWRFNMLLSSVFASFALGLAGLGLFGIVAYTAGRRTHEMGIRAAIGATPADIRRLLTQEGLSMVAVGIVIGTGVALAGSSVVSNLLYGIESTDAASWVTSVLVLGGTGFLACYLPAHRGARVSPLVALRHE